MKFLSRQASTLIGGGIGAVWVFHGLYSKIFNGVPRHRAIVSRVLGEEIAVSATRLVGALEVLLGIWAWSGRKRKACALTQTIALGSMNTLEIVRARDLLISAPGMVVLNACLVALAWLWASSPDDNASR